MKSAPDWREELAGAQCKQPRTADQWSGRPGLYSPVLAIRLASVRSNELPPMAGGSATRNASCAWCSPFTVLVAVVPSSVLPPHLQDCGRCDRSAEKNFARSAEGVWHGKCLRKSRDSRPGQAAAQVREEVMSC